MVVGSSGRWYNLPLTGDVVTGSVVGPYRLAGPLGRGGMGVVYVADDLRLGRRVAVKVVAPQLSADAQFRARFLRESRLAASLDHPNIIPVYEAGEVDGTLYLVMRYVEGRDLKELLARDGRLDPARAVRLVAQVASALDAAHARGLIHRDVKPGNILLGRGPDGDHAYLCDFGLTKERHAHTDLSRTGRMVGTLEYMPPEQIRGEDLDARADVYALGGVLFRCLTGNAPFRGAEAAVMMGHLQEPPPKLSANRPELGTDIDAVIAKAMAKERQHRYQTCTELAEAAADALADPGGGATRPGRAPTDHFDMAADALLRGRVVALFGAGAGQCARPEGSRWAPGSRDLLPRGPELAEYLANAFFYRDADRDNLLRVSQYAAVKAGSGPLYEHLHEVFDVECPPSPLHRLFAGLPAAMRRISDAPRFPVVLTTTYDDRLERAFRDAGEPVEVVTYLAETDHRGKFLHRVWDSGETVVIHSPNDYTGLDLDRRPAILKIHGTVDRGDPSADSYVITEDDYLDYVSYTDISGFVPAPLAVALQRSHFLFLGYRLQDWNLRFTLHRIWGRQSHRYTSWSVQRHVSELDRRFCEQRRIEVIEMRLEDYTARLEDALQNRLALAATT